MASNYQAHTIIFIHPSRSMRTTIHLVSILSAFYADTGKILVFSGEKGKSFSAQTRPVENEKTETNAMNSARLE